jgi:hypothetical protein
MRKETAAALFKIICRRFPGRAKGNNGKKLIRVVCFPADIRTGHLTYAGQNN